MVDANRMQQVLANLLVNAIRFSPTGAAVCMLKVDIVGDSYSREYVIDLGPGVPARNLKVVYFKNSRRQIVLIVAPLVAQGLGLRSVQAVDRVYGWLYWLSTEYTPQGACFYIELPLL